MASNHCFFLPVPPSVTRRRACNVPYPGSCWRFRTRELPACAPFGVCAPLPGVPSPAAVPRAFPGRPPATPSAEPPSFLLPNCALRRDCSPWASTAPAARSPRQSQSGVGLRLCAAGGPARLQHGHEGDLGPARLSPASQVLPSHGSCRPRPHCCRHPVSWAVRPGPPCCAPSRLEVRAHAPQAILPGRRAAKDVHSHAEAPRKVTRAPAGRLPPNARSALLGLHVALGLGPEGCFLK